ncbi:ABC transporter permease [Paenibacillus sp. 1011MAR3C5]|uniref:ABC transporter permease n=1 Tax=Paenibacillus sp. 1011MAR3C5 TaxID=1675787 RepID=UPI000E6C809B|nr:ABC transporter permease [Paenibacillus sp. 1011MAR3C5]RJE91131.1 ABC transporter permease [Paenibacillus sp. 1011MAR3C5]
MLPASHDPAALWRTRAKDFRNEIKPYIRYMAMSGFPSFLSLVFIASAIGYFTLVRDVPADFPIVQVGVLVMTPVLSWSPMRTYLAGADVVYLMPREHEMGPYLRSSFQRTIVKSVFLAAAVILLYLPIYRQVGTGSDLVWIVFAALVLKAANAAGGWQERKLAWNSMRLLLRSARWLLTGLAVAAWLLTSPWQALLFTALCAVLAFVCYRLPQRHRLPWERLIAEEAVTRRRYYAFFGLFIDVPVLPSSIKRRAYLSWILPRIPFAHRYTFNYLFSATLFRSEIGGILIRILLLGALVNYMTADAASLSGWVAAFVYALFGIVFSLQLGGLRSVHRYSVWKHVYPLPDDKQTDQLIQVDRVALAAGLLLLWLPAALPLLLTGIVTPPVVMLIGALAYLAVRPMRLRRKIRSDADED